jgi:predicted nucleic acid-binding Zn ribbon protein
MMERIGDEVARELARGGGREALPLAAITAVWRDAVGDTVARHAWPLRVGRDGTLHVATSSATWAFELDRLAVEVGEKLEARLGDDAPAKLRFAVGPVPEPPSPREAQVNPVEAVRPSPGVKREAAAAAAAIEDPELRELVARAARASLSRAPSDRRF